MTFLETGNFPAGGGELPSLENDEFMSIYNDLKEPVGVFEGEPWQVVLPTNLVVLQCGSGCVDGTGLPCFEEELLSDDCTDCLPSE